MPRWSPSSGHNRVAISFLAANAVFSVHTMWAALWRNGYFGALMRLWEDGPHMLPGTSNPILTKYTSIRPLDRLITFSVVPFANVTDGSTPQFSLFAFHFSGQWASVLTIVFMEGLRTGNGDSIMSLSMAWLLFMQLVTYGCGMPLYGLVHLWNPLSALSAGKGFGKQTEIRNIEALRDLPLSVLIGYGIPTVLMSIPFGNNLLHQWFGGAWQGHPIWIVLLQLLTRILRNQLNRKSTRSEQDTASSLVSVDGPYSSRLRNRAYLFAFGTAAVTHVASLAIVGSRTLFPSLFSQWARDTITFRSTYQPPPFWANAPMKSMATAVLNFFQYDLYGGSTASIVWSLTLYLRSRRTQLGLRQGLSLFCKMLGSCIVAGPSAVLVFLMWSRDEEARLADQDEQEKET